MAAALNKPERLSAAARARVESDELVVSPMVLVELASTIGLHVSGLSFDRIAETALALKWVRDPFDRLIVATAAVEGMSLISKDQLIRDNYPQAIW